MGLGGSTVRMPHARKMKNLIYSASVTWQPDRRKGWNLAKKSVEISIPKTKYHLTTPYHPRVNGQIGKFQWYVM